MRFPVKRNDRTQKGCGLAAPLPHSYSHSSSAFSGIRCHWKQCGHSNSSHSPSSETADELPSHPLAIILSAESVSRSCVTVMPSSTSDGPPSLWHCEHSNSSPTMSFRVENLFCLGDQQDKLLGREFAQIDHRVLRLLTSTLSNGAVARPG